jgi:glycosyltransferase EpsE
MPTRNSSKTIEKSVNSLLVQTFSDFELILLDDNYLEEESQLLGEITKSDPRIRLIKSSEHRKTFGHIGELLNLGIKNSSGFFIARQDADDFSLPHRFQEQIIALNRMNLDLIGSQAIFINSDLNYESISELPIKHLDISQYAQYSNPFIHSSIMFRRSMLATLYGYDENLSTGQDYELWRRVIQNGFNVANTKSPLVLVMRHAESISSRISIENHNQNIRIILGSDRNMNYREGYFLKKALVIEKIRQKRYCGLVNLNSLRVLARLGLLYVNGYFLFYRRGHKIISNRRKIK